MAVRVAVRLRGDAAIGHKLALRAGADGTGGVRAGPFPSQSIHGGRTMRLITAILFIFAIFLVDGHSIRVGEEERRIWMPIALATFTLVLLARVPLLLRIRQSVLTNPAFLLYLVYLAWLGVTQFWSIGAAEGRNHILALWIAMLAALSLSDEHPHRTALIFAGILLLAIVVSWIGAGLGMSWVKGTEETWRMKGVMRHQQTMALVCIAGLILLAVWHLNRKRAGATSPTGWLSLLALLVLATLLATKGRSLAVFFVVTLFIVAFFHLDGAAKMWAIVAAVVVGGGLWVAVDIILPLVSRGGEETLSGRLVVWELTLAEIEKRPLGGFGFGTYGKYFFSLWNNWAPAHAHNLWLQTTFETGIIGAVLYTLFLMAVVRQGLLYQKTTGALSYSLALAIFCILGGWTSVFLGEKITTLYGLLLILMFQEERLRQALAATPQSRPVHDAQAQPA